MEVLEVAKSLSLSTTLFIIHELKVVEYVLKAHMYSIVEQVSWEKIN